MDSMKLGETLWEMHMENIRGMDHIVERSMIHGESGLLLYLYHVGRPMFPGELTEKLGLTTGRVANILKVLEESNLVMRTPDGLDRRRVLVALTPEGEAVAAERTRESVAFHAQLISPLTQDEANQFLYLLKRMAEGIGERKT